MRKLGRAYDQFLVLTGMVPGVIVGLLAIGVAAEIFARSLGLTGFYWMLEVVEYGLLTLTMVGAAYLLRIGRHVTVDLIPNMLPARARRWLEVAVNILILLISLVVLYYGIQVTLLAYAEDSTLYKSFDIKEWVPMAVVPGGMALFTIEAVRRLARSLTKDITGDGDESGPAEVL